LPVSGILTAISSPAHVQYYRLFIDAVSAAEIMQHLFTNVSWIEDTELHIHVVLDVLVFPVTNN
jgi:hypothetical protein